MTERSSKTDAQYRKIAYNIISQFEIEENKTVIEAFDDFIKWLKDRAEQKKWKKNTIKLYRAALNHYFKNALKISEISNKAFPLSLGEQAKRKPKSGSAQKAKFVNPEALNALRELALNTNSKNLVMGYALIKAGIAFGLRPSEWVSARFEESDDGLLKLITKNAKHSEVRAHGPSRTLIIVLPEIIEEEIEIAKWIISEIEKKGYDENQWEKVIKQVSTTIKTYREKHPALKKKPTLTLYSARHQFAANAKKAGLKPEEIGALMGHASKYTCISTYGKRRKGNGGQFPLQANAPEVEIVKERSAKSSRGIREAENLTSKPSWLKM